MFNTLHHTIIHDDSDIWMNEMMILAFAFINGNLMTSLFCCSVTYVVRQCDLTCRLHYSFVLNSIY